MGTSSLNTAALLVIFSAVITPAYGAGTAAPGGTAAGAATQIGPASAGTIPAMPGTIVPGIGGQTLGTGNPALTNQALSNRTLSNQTIAYQTLANQGLMNGGIANGGLIGGLTPSQQDFLMNFASPTTAAPPAQQMESKAQANADAALRGSPPFSPTENITGSTTAIASASLGNGAVTTAPVVSPPVMNNAGTMAETLQPAR